MKTISILLLALFSFEVQLPQGDNVEFVCQKIHKASNTCYFNFVVDGARYTYVDSGCKKSKNKEEVIKKAKEGKLALSKDWKIDCPEAKK